jgi:LPXTG-motif cell wall-anchored protein
MRLVAIAAIAAVVLLFPATALAHAELLETTPAAGATVEGTPDVLAAAFDEALEAESSLSIRDAAGERLAVGRVDPDDPKRVVITDVPDLAPGTYEMRWTAATADGHVERGTWSFTVEAAPTPAPTPEPADSGAPSAAPTPSATPEPTAAPTPSASAGPTDPTGSATGSDVILPIIAGLAIVLIAAGFLLARRGRPSDGV